MTQIFRFGCFAVLMIISCCATVAQEIRFESFFRALDHCRLALETSSSLEGDELTFVGRTTEVVAPVVVPESNVVLLAGYSSEVEVWQMDESGHLLRMKYFPEYAGKQRRTCELGLPDELVAISSVEAENWSAQFKSYRAALVTQGTHEISNPDPIYPINLGFRRIGENPDGCRVVTGLFIDTGETEDGYFRLSSGEQSGNCGAQATTSQADD